MKIKIIIFVFMIFGILGNIIFIPQYADKEVFEYEIIKDSIYVNKFNIIDSIRAQSSINKVLEDNSFGFMIESNNYKEFKERKININMYLHRDSLFLLKKNNKDIAKLFREVVSRNNYFLSNFYVRVNLIFLPEDLKNEEVIYQEAFSRK